MRVLCASPAGAGHFSSGGPAAVREPKPDRASRIREALQPLFVAHAMRARSREVADQIAQPPTISDLSLG